MALHRLAAVALALLLHSSLAWSSARDASSSAQEGSLGQQQEERLEETQVSNAERVYEEVHTEGAALARARRQLEQARAEDAASQRRFSMRFAGIGLAHRKPVHGAALLQQKAGGGAALKADSAEEAAVAAVLQQEARAEDLQAQGAEKAYSMVHTENAELAKAKQELEQTRKEDAAAMWALDARMAGLSRPHAALLQQKAGGGAALKEDSAERAAIEAVQLREARAEDLQVRNAEEAFDEISASNPQVADIGQQIEEERRVDAVNLQQLHGRLAGLLAVRRKH